MPRDVDRRRRSSFLRVESVPVPVGPPVPWCNPSPLVGPASSRSRVTAHAFREVDRATHSRPRGMPCAQR